MTRSEDTATRRGFLRSASTGAAVVSAGVAGASTGAVAQEGSETGGNATGGEGGETDGHSAGEGGQLVLTDSLLMILGFAVIGILSPIVFALFLARKYRGAGRSAAGSQHR